MANRETVNRNARAPIGKKGHIPWNKTMTTKKQTLGGTNGMNKIGFVEEKTFGTKPGNIKPITLLPIQREPVTEKTKRLLKVDARFDCPCCGKGVQIQIGYDMTDSKG